MSKGQTKKGTSIEIKPFNAKEIAQLQMILDKPHWGRRKLKDEFIAENGRLSKEVDAYIMANGKRKGKGKGKIKDNSGSMSTKGEPTPKLTAKTRGGEPLGKGSGTPSELRVPFTGLRIEGAVLVIEYER